MAATREGLSWHWSLHITSVCGRDARRGQDLRIVESLCESAISQTVATLKLVVMVIVEEEHCLAAWVSFETARFRGQVFEKIAVLVMP